MSAPLSPAPLPPTVRRLGWISFWADVSSEMVYPLLGLFLTRILGAPFALLGLVEGIAEGVVSFMKGLAGVRSDRSGRRVPWVQWGYGLSAIGKPMIALAMGWPMVLFARVTDRVGKGVRTTARDVLITESVDSGSRGRAFGFHRSMDTTGALIGTFTTWGVLLVAPNPLPEAWFRVLFVVAGVPAAISVYLTFRLVEPKVHPHAEIQKLPLRKVCGRMPRVFWWTLGVTTLFCIANSSDTFLLLRASKSGLSDAAVVGVAGLYNVVYALVSYPAGAWSDKIGRWKMMVAGWVLYALVYAGFATYSGGVSGYLGLFALYGVYIGLTKAVGAALVADLAPSDLKGSAMGLFAMVNGFATIAASGLTGILWDRHGSSVAFGVSAGLALVAADLVPWVVVQSKEINLATDG